MKPRVLSNKLELRLLTDCIMNANADNPFFSIITPTFNRAHLISTAIKSVLSQRFLNFEYIIIDDGSSDNTKEIVESFKDKRLKYFWIENKERGFARNYGIKKSLGKYINFLDSDDFFHDNHLEIAYDFILTNAEPPFFFQGYKIVNKSGTEVNNTIFPLTKTIEKICWNNMLAPIGAFVRKDVLLENLFDEDYNFRIAEDLYVWLKIAAKHGLIFNTKISASMINHELRTMRTLNPNDVIYCRDKLINLLLTDNAFKSKYNNCIDAIYSSQTSLAILSLTELKDYKKSFRQIVLLLVTHFKEIFRKRTYVIFRNIVFNWFKELINRFKFFK